MLTTTPTRIVRDRLEQLPAVTQGRLLATARVTIGALLLVAPRLATRPMLRERAGDDAAMFARAMGGRDVALGVGALVAAGRGPSAMRGWIEAGALADAVDVAAFGGSGRPLRPLGRLLLTVVAASGVALGVHAARRLGDEG